MRFPTTKRKNKILAEKYITFVSYYYICHAFTPYSRLFYTMRKSTTFLTSNPKITFAMSTISSFLDLYDRLQTLPRRSRVAVCHPSDGHTLRAVVEAVEMGFIHAVLVGETHEKTLLNLSPEVSAHIERRPASTAADAIRQAVQLVHNGEADILMKGMVNTDDLLHEVLNKTYGLRPEGNVISHVAVFETSETDRLLILSDVAVIPFPTLEQRAAQIRYTTAVARSLGIEVPRIALLHFTEKVNEKFPLTLDYETLKTQAAQGEFGSVLLDGPMDLLCAILPVALTNKGLKSCLEGEADILLMPDIQAGNILYKALQYFPQSSTSASMLCGTSAPVVLTSRGDTIETKINSLALAALQCPLT